MVRLTVAFMVLLIVGCTSNPTNLRVTEYNLCMKIDTGESASVHEARCARHLKGPSPLDSPGGQMPQAVVVFPAAP